MFLALRRVFEIMSTIKSNSISVFAFAFIPSILFQ